VFFTFLKKTNATELWSPISSRPEPGNHCRTKKRDGENNIITMDASSSSSSSSSSSIKRQNKNDV
jgi:hypothetical protein